MMKYSMKYLHLLFDIHLVVSVVVLENVTLTCFFYLSMVTPLWDVQLCITMPRWFDYSLREEQTWKLQVRCV